MMLNDCVISPFYMKKQCFRLDDKNKFAVVKIYNKKNCITKKFYYIKVMLRWGPLQKERHDEKK